MHGSAVEVRDGVLPFQPQYALWSDGAIKRRWLYIPPNSYIDGSDPDHCKFRPGTRLWKAFSQAGRRIETRFIERRQDGVWQFATYAWNTDDSDATLARADRISRLPVADAPGGIYELLSEEDCRACHKSGAVPVLGVSALQLSPDRDPQAPHGMAAYPSGKELDLFGLIERGWQRHLPPEQLLNPPRITARSPTERAALGYLHGNPDASVLALRMRTRNSKVQMPALGTRLADAEGVALINDGSPTICHNKPRKRFHEEKHRINRGMAGRLVSYQHGDCRTLGREHYL